MVHFSCNFHLRVQKEDQMPSLWLLRFCLSRPQPVSEHSRTKPVGMLRENKALAWRDWQETDRVVGYVFLVILPARYLLWLYIHSFLHPHLPTPWTLTKEVPRLLEFMEIMTLCPVNLLQRLELWCLAALFVVVWLWGGGKKCHFNLFSPLFLPSDPQSSRENSNFEDGPWSVTNLNPTNRCFWPSKSWSS